MKIVTKKYEAILKSRLFFSFYKYFFFVFDDPGLKPFKDFANNSNRLICIDR